MLTSWFNDAVAYVDQIEDTISKWWDSADVRSFRKDVVAYADQIHTAVADFFEESGINDFVTEIERHYQGFSDIMPVSIMWFVPGIVAYLSPFTTISALLAPTTFFQVLAVIGFIFYLYRCGEQIALQKEIEEISLLTT